MTKHVAVRINSTTVRVTHTHIYTTSKKQPASTNSQDACDIQWLCYPLHLWKSIARHTGVEMHKSSLIPFWNEAPVASVAFFFGTRLQRRLVTACPESRWVHFFLFQSIILVGLTQTFFLCLQKMVLYFGHCYFIKSWFGLDRTFSRGYFQSLAHVGISHCFVPSLGSARVSVQPRFVGENDCVLHYSFSEASNVSIV